MKKTNRMLSALLALLTILTFMLPASAVEVIEKAEVFMQLPTAGMKCKELHPLSSDPEKFELSIRRVYYWAVDEKGNQTESCTMQPDDVFRTDVQYWCRIEFLPKPGYAIEKKTTKIIVNGKDLTDTYGTVLSNGCEIVFKAKPAQQEEEPQTENCPYCHEPHTGFFAPLIRFFHNIFYALFGEKKK